MWITTKLSSNNTAIAPYVLTCIEISIQFLNIVRVKNNGKIKKD